MGTCCWMNKKVDDDDKVEKGRNRLDKSNSKSHKIVYDKKENEYKGSIEMDDRLFSFNSGMKRCD